MLFFLGCRIPFLFFFSCRARAGGRCCFFSPFRMAMKRLIPSLFFFPPFSPFEIGFPPSGMEATSFFLRPQPFFSSPFPLLFFRRGRADKWLRPPPPPSFFPAPRLIGKLSPPSPQRGQIEPSCFLFSFDCASPGRAFSPFPPPSPKELLFSSSPAFFPCR